MVDEAPRPVIVWFRRDLRLGDNPAMSAAVETGRPILPLYILDEAGDGRGSGSASLWWLDKSLRALDASVSERGGRLILRRGDSEAELRRLIDETGADRVRMVAASFLVKHLLIDWREGEAWFWDTLVDADHASNAQNWQWVAGCGADAAPWFRIFNPVVQGQKFDSAGRYVRRWVPEIRALPDRLIHAPWTAPSAVLADAGVRLGHSYPRPVVDHAQARLRALGALKTHAEGSRNATRDETPLSRGSSLS